MTGRPKPPKRRWRRRARLILAALAVLIGVPLVYLCWRIRAAAHVAPDRPADVIIVLGCGKALYPDRMEHGLELLNKGFAPRIMVTGRTPDAEWARAYLRACGAPEEAVVIENRSTTTCENLKYSQEIMAENGWQDAIVVTCGYHMYRALRMARDLGMDVQGGAANTYVEQSFYLRWKHTLIDAVKYTVYVVAGA